MNSARTALQIMLSTNASSIEALRKSTRVATLPFEQRVDHTMTSQRAPLRVRRTRPSATNNSSVTHAPVSDRDRAAAYHILLTGSRNEENPEEIAASPAEMLAILHHHLSGSEPRIAVKSCVLETITKQIIRIISQKQIYNVDDAWLWDDLFGQGIIAMDGSLDTKYCSIWLLRFYHLLWVGSRNYKDVIVPTEVAFYMMNECFDKDLFFKERTGDGSIILENDGTDESFLEGSVTVSLRYHIVDRSGFEFTTVERIKEILRILSNEQR